MSQEYRYCALSNAQCLGSSVRCSTRPLPERPSPNMSTRDGDGARRRPRAASPRGAPRGARCVEFAPDVGSAASPRQQRRLRSAQLLAPLLPAGFPDSVTPDYLPFQVWDSVQGLCSYVRGSFATAALLRGVGVGTANASALSATAAFLARDMTGHVFCLCFALLQGGALDAAAKQWRFAADCANNVGYAFELLSPAVPRSLFVPCVCAASLAHAFTGVAGGATRAALTAHFARAHNAADVAAKENAQETTVTLLGVCAGYLAVRATASSALLQWSVFLCLTACHVYANARAMRALRLTSLNRERLALLTWHHTISGAVLSVAEVAALEPLLPRPLRWRRSPAPDVRLGVPLAAVRRAPAAGEAFVAARAQGKGRSSCICVALQRGSSAEDAAAAFAHAVRAAARCGPDAAALDAALAAPQALEWTAFASQLRARGWDTARLQLLCHDEGWRFDWQQAAS